MKNRTSFAIGAASGVAASALGLVLAAVYYHDQERREYARVRDAIREVAQEQQEREDAASDWEVRRSRMAAAIDNLTTLVANSHGEARSEATDKLAELRMRYDQHMLNEPR